MVKADGCVAVHADGGAYKPLNWMNAPNRLIIEPPAETAGHQADETADETDDEAAADPAVVSDDESGASVWRVVSANSRDTLIINIEHILHDSSHEMGVDPGLRKDGAEVHLQELLAENPSAISAGLKLVRREYPTAIGPVDLLCRDDAGQTVAVEIKRHGEIDGVEQLTRYLHYLNSDPTLAPVRGVFVARTIRPQAKVLASGRSIECVEVDYDELRGIESPELRLF